MKTITHRIQTLLGGVTLGILTLGFGTNAGAQTARITFQANVAVSKRISYNQLFSMNPDGSGVTQLTGTSTSSLCPRWSPGQAYISFIRAGLLWIMPAQGEVNGGQSFAVAQAGGGGADWSPDGSALVFQGTNGGLYVVPVNTSTGTAGTPVLFHSGEWFYPSWSPDGTRIAANGSDDGTLNLIGVFDAATGAELVTFSAGAVSGLTPNFTAQWSPDSTHIAFSGPVTVSTKRGTTTYHEIFLANADGTGLTRVTYLNSDSRFPTWSPDGTTLAFRSVFSGTASIYKMLLGSGTVTLVHSPGNNLDWNP